MNPKISRLASLLGSVSLLAMAGAGRSEAQQLAQGQVAQAAPADVPEQVLVTGSLIRGTASVGVPLTNLSPQDFAVTGALTTADLFRTVPAATVAPGPVATQTGENVGKATRVNIRGLDPNKATRELMMVDGVRFPPQGQSGDQIDPSVIPALALDRIDILVDGASASYGADAVTGVINLILKRGYDGAVTQLRTNLANGKTGYQASQLWGRTWDGGDITLTYEWEDYSPLRGNARSNVTLDFTPWGLDNRTPLRSSVPATLSVGNPAQPASLGLGTGGTNSLGRNCTNCFAIPAGSGANFNSSLNSGLGPLAPSSAPGVLNWATLSTAANGGATNPAGGTANEINPYAISWFDAATQRNSLVGTVDQRLTRDISFYGEGFYSNRRAEFLNSSITSADSANDLFVAVPTNNPYFPAGAPGTLRVNYNISAEVPSFTSASEVANRYLGGVKLDLPGDWEGRIYYSESFDGLRDRVNAVNTNALSAALGWTIPASAPTGTAPSMGTWTKPGAVPYLNLFCDPRTFVCNSPTTLNYITGIAQYSSSTWINEKGVNFDGPLFSLPAGEVKAAIGGTYTTESFLFTVLDNTAAPSLLVPALAESQRRQFWSAFAQLNIPLLGDNFSLPLVQRFDIEASWRHDQYSDFGGTSNPKIGFNWTVDQDIGLIFRGAWGTSFRAPSFAENSALASNSTNAFNSSVFTNSSGISVQCNPAANSLAGRLLNPGAGLTGWNGTVANGGTPGTSCGTPAQPVGLAVAASGANAISYGLRNYVNKEPTLRPETATNYGFTVEFAPTAFLKGLDVEATWYQIKISNALVDFSKPNTASVNDPSLGFSYIVPTDIAKAGVDVAGCSNNNTPTTCPEFEQMVNAILRDPRNPVPLAIATSVLWINDGSTGNFGWVKLQGIDFNVSYDIDAGDWGAWNAGISGTYYLHNYRVNDVSATDPEAGVVQDNFHTTIGSFNGIQQTGVETLPRMKYRARLGWSDGAFSVTGFVNYTSHFFNTQNAPPNVNFACVTAGGTVGGGTFPCAINNYTGIVPSYYTFDLSLGYDTGTQPANPYLQHLGIQLVVQNIMGRSPAFEYRTAQPVAFDVTQSDLGRSFGIVLTKTW